MVNDFKKVLKEKKDKKDKKGLNKKIVVRNILKKSQRATVNIPDYKAPSILGDPNRFFKSEMEEAKRAMFFQ